jgi:zinc transporter, ZIP family
MTAVGLLAGTLIYVGADTWLSRNEEMKAMRRSIHAAAAGRPLERSQGTVELARGETIAAGLVVDSVPESIALGLTVAEDEVVSPFSPGSSSGTSSGVWRAQPIIAGGRSKRFTLVFLAGIGATLAVATVLGGALLSEASDSLVGSAEAIAAGAVLAVISISIVPYAFSEVSSLVATATVLGFVGGYLLS